MGIRSGDAAFSEPLMGAQPTGPLAGIRVIDLTTVVLGPFATQTLGDMGADVIKIETPAGDAVRYIGPSRTPGMGSYYANLNRNKRNIVLDLKTEPAKQALWKLVAGADIVVHNMRLGAAERLGLSYENLQKINPRIILACASGFTKTRRRGTTRPMMISSRAAPAWPA